MSWDRGLKMGRLLASFGMERWLRVPLMLSLTKGWNFNSISILMICVEYITGTLPIFPMIRSIEWLSRVCRLELSSNNILVILITLSFEKARIHGFLLFLTHLSCITAFCVSVSSRASWSWILTLLWNRFVLINLNIYRGAIVHSIVWVVLSNTRLRSLMSYCLLGLNIALIDVDGGHLINRWVMHQFSFQTINLRVIVTFI